MATRSKTPSTSPTRTAARKSPAKGADNRASNTAKVEKMTEIKTKPLPAATSTPTTPPAVTQAANSAKPGKGVKAAKVTKTADKPKKAKLVRDSFTIPKAEYEAIAALKLRAAKLGQTPKKSELLRAGLKALMAMGDAALLTSLAAVPAVKTGRPAA